MRLILCAVLIFSSASALLQEGELSPEYIECLQEKVRNANGANAMEMIGETADLNCIEISMWMTASRDDTCRPLSSENWNWYYSLLGDSASGGARRQKRWHNEKRMRKEYRRLTDNERDAFHAALQGLKNDRSVEPNKYEALARLHNPCDFPNAHGGPAFFGYHRVLLLLFENALREIDPDVTLPYWDTTMENELTDPRFSNMWTEKFMGTANGVVTSGPAARWRTNAGTSLIRNVGDSTQLISRNDIANVMGQAYMQDISVPTAGPFSDLEGHHATIHNWVGGDMMNLPTAANDPLFWMHHAFIDCVWKNFQEMQDGMGVDSASDYPRAYGSEVHNPYRQLGIGNMRNIDSYSRNFTELYGCEAPPTCSEDRPTCDSPYLTCNTTTYFCVPVTPSEPEPTEPEPTNPPPCSDQPMPPVYQNSYCIDGVCDVAEWAYVPVQIIYNRPQAIDSRSAYPVKNNVPNTSSDIYAPETYGGVYAYRGSKQEIPTDKCKRQKSRATAGAVAVETTGVSYRGAYREYSLIDQRLPISSSTTYVGIKNPAKGHSKAMVRAYDECGRICRPVCRDAMTRRSTPCSGVIEASMQNPMQFGSDYESATYETWNYDNPDFPIYTGDTAFLTFYCDNTGTFPWQDYGDMDAEMTRPPTTKSTYRPSATTTTESVYHEQEETTPRPYVSATTTTESSYHHQEETTRRPYVPATTTTESSYHHQEETTRRPYVATPTTRKTYQSKTTNKSPYGIQTKPTTKPNYQQKTTKPSYMAETTKRPYYTSKVSITTKTPIPWYMTKTTNKPYYTRPTKPTTKEQTYSKTTTRSPYGGESKPTTKSQYGSKTTKKPYNTRTTKATTASPSYHQQKTSRRPYNGAPDPPTTTPRAPDCDTGSYCVGGQQSDKYCTKCKTGSLHKCSGSCQSFLYCYAGIYFKFNCREGDSFDSLQQMCKPNYMVEC